MMACEVLLADAAYIHSSFALVLSSNDFLEQVASGLRIRSNILQASNGF